MPGPDYILDVTGLTQPGADAPSASGRAKSSSRGWLAIRWRCCGAYSRIYRNRAGTAYIGHCPRCAKPLRVPIGEGGTDCRFFEAG